MLRGSSSRTREGLSSGWTSLRVASSRMLPPLPIRTGARAPVAGQVAQFLFAPVDAAHQLRRARRTMVVRGGVPVGLRRAGR